MTWTLARKHFQCSPQWRRDVLLLVCAAYRKFSVWLHPHQQLCRCINFDLAQCIEHIDRVFNEAKAMWNDAVSGFSSLFVEAQKMATSIGREIRALRQCGPQVNWDSYGTSDLQTYYRLSTYIPFLDFFIHKFQVWFFKHRGNCAASSPCYSTALQRKEQT
jgi:hypothetical protein